VEIPDPQYLETHDGAYIAYQTVGEGPIDIAWQVEFGGNPRRVVGAAMGGPMV
jgi:hypothetical protein